MDIIAILKNRSEIRTFDSGAQLQEFYADNQQYNQNTGEMYSNFLKFQLWGNKTQLLNNFQEGQRVKIHFNIKGDFFTKEDGTKAHFTNLTAWKIEAMGQTQPTQPTQHQAPINNDEEEDLPF